MVRKVFQVKGTVQDTDSDWEEGEEGEEEQEEEEEEDEVVILRGCTRSELRKSVHIFPHSSNQDSLVKRTEYQDQRLPRFK
jgi:hypothetical protein